MAARPDNKDLGNATAKLFGTSRPIRRMNGLPPNPTQLSSWLEGEERLRNPPGWRTVPAKVAFGHRPSKNLGGMFKGVQNVVDLHPAVMESRTSPWYSPRDPKNPNNPLPPMKKPQDLGKYVSRGLGRLLRLRWPPVYSPNDNMPNKKVKT